MKIVTTVVRWIVGILFIFSGAIKANDPLGLAYKMQEFFEVWGWHGLHSMALPLAIIMIAFEIIAGVAVILGWQFQLFSWLLLALILFFTFLTGYALFSGTIRECGCFGDCIKLSADQSFIKDIILTFLIGLLFLYRKQVQPGLSKSLSILILAITTVVAVAIQFYVLRNQPLIDCLPYKKGTHIPEKMRIPPGSVPDSVVIQFVYQKDGKQVEFDSDHFPPDFNDSLYQFVKRYDKVVRVGNAIPPIKDFVAITESGTDTTMALLSNPGYSILIFAQVLPPDAGNWPWAGELTQLHQAATAKKIPVSWISSDAPALQRTLSSLGMGNVPVLKGDLVAIKTAARVNPTLVLIRQGTIIDKYSHTDLGKMTKTISALR